MSAAESSATLILCGQLIDGTGAAPRSEAAVLVRNGRIEAVGGRELLARPDVQGAERVEARADTLIPGLIDGHAHIAWGNARLPGWEAARSHRDTLVAWAVAGAQAALRAGVTTLHDCGAPDGVSLSVRETLRSGALLGPRLLACGPCITTTAGHGRGLGVVADSADELRRRVRELCERGADFIKIMATGGLSDPETNRRRAQYGEEELRAAVDDAHRLGRPVVTHANATEGIRHAVAAGVDVVAHCNWLGTAEGTLDYDPVVVEQMVRRGVYVDLNVEGATRPLEGDDGWMPGWTSATAARNRWELFDAMRRRGVPIFFSSDRYGPGLAAFPRLLAEAARSLALPAEELVWRATGLAAEAIGLGGRVGTIQPGAVADLVVLEGDLVADLSVLTCPVRVYQAGRLVMRDGLLAPPLAALQPGYW